ncbi:hypothetical protein AB1Y20_017928 [Prymnesium parvum]|uniref:Uncharacterized protein n=1 Tax=Prymnesium parvum TaxID=97485 RepID=A0AB34JN30_PRYPA
MGESQRLNAASSELESEALAFAIADKSVLELKKILLEAELDPDECSDKAELRACVLSAIRSGSASLSGDARKRRGYPPRLKPAPKKLGVRRPRGKPARVRVAPLDVDEAPEAEGRCACGWRPLLRAAAAVVLAGCLLAAAYLWVRFSRGEVEPSREVEVVAASQQPSTPPPPGFPSPGFPPPSAPPRGPPKNCRNDPDWRPADHPSRNCAWLADAKHRWRCKGDERLYLANVKVHCPLSCDDDCLPPSPPSPPLSPPPIPALPESSSLPPPPQPGAEIVAKLNNRFHRPVSGEQAVWNDDGSLREQGVLVHIVDGYEQEGKPWLPRADSEVLSGSLVFDAQQPDPGGTWYGVPLFSGGQGVGVVLRPERNRILCGFGGDAGGRCTRGGKTITWCNSAELTDPPGYCNGYPWHPEEVGIMLERTVRSAWRGQYNEFIIDAPVWRRNLPHSIEAIFYVDSSHQDKARRILEQFKAEYGVTEDTHPLMQLVVSDWSSPFHLARS